MTIENVEVEKLYFNLFPSRKEEAYMRMLLIVVFEHIRANGRVSQHHLCRSVCNFYPYAEDDVLIAVSALVNPVIFGVVARFKLNRKQARLPEVINLSVKNDKLKDYLSWYDTVLDQFTELKKISA